MQGREAINSLLGAERQGPQTPHIPSTNLGPGRRWTGKFGGSRQDPCSSVPPITPTPVPPCPLWTAKFFIGWVEKCKSALSSAVSSQSSYKLPLFPGFQVRAFQWSHKPLGEHPPGSRSGCSHSGSECVRPATSSAHARSTSWRSSVVRGGWSGLRLRAPEPWALGVHFLRPLCVFLIFKLVFLKQMFRCIFSLWFESLLY